MAEPGKDRLEDRAALRRIGDRGSAGRQVRGNGAFQVEGEVRMGEQIRVPVALARRAGDVDLTVEIVKPDLDPPRLTAPPPARRDVDRSIAEQSLSDVVVHAFIS